MSTVRKGDIIFHGAYQETYAISVVTDDVISTSDGNDYKVNTKYHFLSTPLKMRTIRGWLKSNYSRYSAFDKWGGCKQLYLSSLSLNQAKYILSNIFEIEKDSKTKKFLKDLLNDITSDDQDSDEDINEIDTIIDKEKDTPMPSWKGIPSIQVLQTSSITEVIKPKRNKTTSARALKIANYECENDHDSKRVFLRKNGINYTEPHHLIPLSKFRDFEIDNTGKYRAIDIEENIVSLCSYCHNLFHYGKMEDKMPILEKLYKDRKDGLKEAGINISFDQLKNYYM